MLEDLRYCLNPVCRNELPADAASCPHCGRAVDAPDLGHDGGALLPPPPREQPPLWRDAGLTLWNVGGWVLFLLWLYGAYWGHFKYPEEFSAARLVVVGLPAALWWLADTAVHRPKPWMVGLGLGLIVYGFFPVAYCAHAVVAAWVLYWVWVRGD